MAIGRKALAARRAVMLSDEAVGRRIIRHCRGFNSGEIRREALCVCGDVDVRRHWRRVAYRYCEFSVRGYVRIIG